MRRIKVSDELRGTRVDVASGNQLTALSRSYIARLIENGRITVNSKDTKAGYKLRAGDELVIDFDEKELDKIPDIDLPIIYEDNDVIVINKPAGVISHSRGRYWDEPSVASFIRQKVKGLEGERAGIVHRLDRATSGIMICAKNSNAQAYLQQQFAKRTVQKTYVAVCEGHIEPNQAVIDAGILRNPKKPTTFMVHKQGKPAQTAYKVLSYAADSTLVEFKPLTGRTHQLRVHAAFIKHPIMGDAFYGNSKESERLLLHANKLTIRIPSGEERTFMAPMPKEFAKYE